MYDYLVCIAFDDVAVVIVLIIVIVAAAIKRWTLTLVAFSKRLLFVSSAKLHKSRIKNCSIRFAVTTYWEMCHCVYSSQLWFINTSYTRPCTLHSFSFIVSFHVALHRKKNKTPPRYTKYAARRDEPPNYERRNFILSWHWISSLCILFRTFYLGFQLTN